MRVLSKITLYNAYPTNDCKPSVNDFCYYNTTSLQFVTNSPFMVWPHWQFSYVLKIDFRKQL